MNPGRLDAFIKPGAVVSVGDFLGGTATIFVTAVHADIKNGRPGFDGLASDGTDVWRYSHQVTAIIQPAPAPAS